MSAVGDMIDAYCADTSVSGERGYVCEYIRDLSASMERVAPMAARARSELQSAASDVARSDAWNAAPTRQTSPMDPEASVAHASSTVAPTSTFAPPHPTVASGARSDIQSAAWNAAPSRQTSPVDPEASVRTPTPTVASGAPGGTPSTAPNTSDGAWLAALMVLGVLFALFTSGSSK